MKLTKQQLL